MLRGDMLDDAMRRALTLAARGPKRDTNPQVGCVVLDPTGRIVAEGWHRGAGTPHAETDALAHVPHEWRERAHELTAVVTLEPCNHVGRTGPCAQALVSFGIGAVAYAADDPGAGPAGGASTGGAQTLRDAGVEVVSGVLRAQVTAALTPWLTQQASNTAGDPQTPTSTPRARPRVIAKWGQTLDGRIAAADGSSRWITGSVARADVHRRRATADAILVGTGTLLADDPALTARASDGALLVPASEQPIPVVVGHREIPADATIRQHPALAHHDLSAPLRLSGDDLDADLATLTDRGIRSVFVEGGPSVITALLAAGLVDELHVYVAPALLGGARLAIGDLGINHISGIQRLQVTETLQLGEDLLLRALPSTDPRKDAYVHGTH